ncbi:tRNA lysidine(34) synthetase TilS [Leucobacter ruminantium]|uniref:tRNA(Ile)-lysidine synthase n=1 Tax=Leucobacter ruminantium TaxID=1289170 RepID=A0A939RUB2_9MICO|nr:tRNA lysidine(34) synthetase TilS [Leucobacter ruminantium]MBO1805520.1 tRNA lysidine(34) synthetase TilS [Leucobacter ruminantium]
MVQRAVLETRASARRALRGWLTERAPEAGRGASPPLVLVALSGGADSLALAAAVAYEAPRVGLRPGAVVVDHGLQRESASVAAGAAEQAAALGLDPVHVERVRVEGERGEGPEAAARDARYAAFARVAGRTRAAAILTAHTRDDQAEQVLLALARGSGLRSIAGIPQRRPLPGSEGAIVLRPFLGERPAITRQTTLAACGELGLEYWRDPHNGDPVYARVRVRERVLPELERELGPGIAAALARSADLARDDADALDALAEETLEEIVEHAEAGIAVSLAALAANPPALRHRMIRTIARAEFGVQLSREHTLAVARLVTDWRGQGPIDVPGASVRRELGRLVFTAR